MSIYLEDNPPARSQFYTKRKATVSGAIVVHTAENVLDTVDIDTGAERVARFISRRTDAAGSYHSIPDSDSTVRLGRYEWQMFGEGTGGNRWALHIGFACRAADWQTAPTGWVEGAMSQGGTEAANMAAWVKSTTGIIVPAERITEAEYRAQKPGFISHAEIDPGRRTDPGTGFPWGMFLGAYIDAPNSPVKTHGWATGEPLAEPIMTLDWAVSEVIQLYLTHRGSDWTADEIGDWRHDLHEKIYVRGEDPRPTLAWINWALDNE